MGDDLTARERNLIEMQQWWTRMALDREPTPAEQARVVALDRQKRAPAPPAPASYSHWGMH